MKMRAIQVTRANGPFEIVERGIPEPGTEQARAKIDGCGICHSDGLTEEGIWPGIRYARVPGRDIAGVIDALGGEVAGWTEGQGGGVRWHGGRLQLLRFVPPRRLRYLSSCAANSRYLIRMRAAFRPRHLWRASAQLMSRAEAESKAHCVCLISLFRLR